MTESTWQFYFNPKGRCTRKDFWQRYFLPVLVAAIVMPFLVYPLPAILNGIIVVTFVALAGWVSIAVQIKRWHDFDRTGWWSALCILPIVGPLAFIYAGLAEGTNGPNRFGPTPSMPTVSIVTEG